MSKPREFWIYHCDGEIIDGYPYEDHKKSEIKLAPFGPDSMGHIHVREVIEGEPDYKKLWMEFLSLQSGDVLKIVSDMEKYKALAQELAEALEFYERTAVMREVQSGLEYVAREALAKYHKALEEK